MHRTVGRLALVCVLVGAVAGGGCIHHRKPFRPGTVYQTVPQDRAYVELGTVRGSSWAWGDPVNGALHEALAEAQAMGADGIVQAQVQEDCGFRWLWCLLIPIPACRADVVAIAVRWEGGVAMPTSGARRAPKKE